MQNTGPHAVTFWALEGRIKAITSARETCAGPLTIRLPVGTNWNWNVACCNVSNAAIDIPVDLGSALIETHHPHAEMLTCCTRRATSRIRKASTDFKSTATVPPVSWHVKAGEGEMRIRMSLLSPLLREQSLRTIISI